MKKELKKIYRINMNTGSGKRVRMKELKAGDYFYFKNGDEPLSEPWIAWEDPFWDKKIQLWVIISNIAANMEV